jgi:hypothetical protein
MQNKPFDWDKYMGETPYNKVLENMRVARLLIPTMFSPCGKYLYLKTEDLDFNVNDYQSLERQKNETEKRFIECYEKLRNSPSFDLIEKLYLLKVDYIILDQLISENPNEEPAPFHPEAILEKLS